MFEPSGLRMRVSGTQVAQGHPTSVAYWRAVDRANRCPLVICRGSRGTLSRRLGCKARFERAFWELTSYERLLRRQSDAALEVLKARVGTYAVEPGINGERDHAVRSFLDGLVEPAEGLVLFSQQDACRRNLIGTHVALLGQLFHLFQPLHGLRPVSSKGVRLHKKSQHERT